MTEYVIYTSTSVPNCPYCHKAKALMDKFKIPYTEHVIGRDLTKAEFIEQYGPDVKTVPQIVIDGQRIGGYEELEERLKGRQAA
jgi:glutaredoxin 3